MHISQRLNRTFRAHHTFRIRHFPRTGTGPSFDPRPPSAPAHATYDFLFATEETIRTGTPCPVISVREELLAPLSSSLSDMVAATASVDDIDLLILRALASRPHFRLTQDCIAGETKAPCMSRPNIAKRLPQLLHAGLVSLPKGKKGGYTITAAVRKMLEMHASS
jgi:hypothetical protein